MKDHGTHQAKCLWLAIDTVLQHENLVGYAWRGGENWRCIHQDFHSLPNSISNPKSLLTTLNGKDFVISWLRKVTVTGKLAREVPLSRPWNEARLWFNKLMEMLGQFAAETGVEAKEREILVWASDSGNEAKPSINVSVVAIFGRWEKSLHSYSLPTMTSLVVHLRPTNQRLWELKYWLTPSQPRLLAPSQPQPPVEKTVGLR